MIRALTAIPLAAVMVTAVVVFAGASWTEYRAHTDQETTR